MALIKRKLLQTTGFDLFEAKDLLFLIPGSAVIPFFLILLLTVRHKWDGKSRKLFIAVTAVYSLLFEVCNGVLTDIVPATASGIIHVIILFFANFLFSVAWMGFYRQLN